MYSHGLRYNLTTSSATLPMTCLVAGVIWLLPSPQSRDLWLSFGIGVLTTLLVMEWNNRSALLRIRSRLMSSTFLFLTALCPFLHDLSWDLATAPCLVLSYILLFRSYQKPRGEGAIFHSFLFLGIGSLLFPPLLCLVPFYWLNMLVQLRSLTARSFMASLFGLVLPYWFYIAYAVWYKRADTVFLYLLDYTNISLPDYGTVPFNRIVSFGFIVFLLLLSIINYLRTYYADKIKTRMFFYAIIVQSVALTLLTAALPRHFDRLFPLMLVTSAPLIAHYVALARGRLMDFWFIILLLLATAWGLFNHFCEWNPLSNIL